MSDTQGTTAGHDTAHVPDVHGTSTEVAGPHGSAADHGDEGHGHDDHAHAEMALGPIDWTMWGAGVLGAAIAMVVVAGLVVATGFTLGA